MQSSLRKSASFAKNGETKMKAEEGMTIQSIKELLLNARNAVFFGGAGVSTASGIPDFRGNGGLYAGDGRSNEYYLSRTCLRREPEKFFDYFRKNMDFSKVQPNDAHYALANLEERGILRSVITQNIDGLHQRAGSKRVIELHGSAERFYCSRCGKIYSSDVLSASTDIPRCTECGAVIRPDVTLYGEALDAYSFADAETEIAKADLLIVGGTSLVVHPAASLVELFEGKHLIIINYSSTPYDGWAEYVIRDSIADVLPALAKE